MLDIFSIRMRLIVSAGPPAGNGTMNRMVRVGNSWAARTPGHETIPIKHNTRMSTDIWTSSLLGQALDPLGEGLDDGLGLLRDQSVARVRNDHHGDTRSEFIFHLVALGFRLERVVRGLQVQARRRATR